MSPPQETPQELIRRIRQNNGVDEDACREAKQNPNAWTTIQNLKRKLEKSLDVLSHDLYTKPAHFVLELLQNMSDNEYPPEVEPQVEIVLNRDHMIAKSNECGFTHSNVEAFCDIGQSTKKNKQGYIGEKGIGAKSMFKVANKVFVHSNGFHFVLDRKDELGMISPRWVDSADSDPGRTSIRLEFCDLNQSGVVRNQLAQVLDTALLFLPKLSHICVEDHSSTRKIVTRSMGTNNIVTIASQQNGQTQNQQFLLVTRSLLPDTQEPKREGATSTEIVLAFPLTEKFTPLIAPQMVHAFLPMRSFGFSFIIQGDFLTAANREDVLNDRPWNEAIRNSVASVFSDAVKTFKTIPDLELTWLKFLPRSNSVTDPFFSPVAKKIISNLSSNDVVLCDDNRYHRPSYAKFSSSFCLSRAKPLIPSTYLPFYYVSSRYDSDVHNKLRELGVSDMSFSDFVVGLVRMKDSIPRQRNRWIEKVCESLLDEAFEWRWGRYQLKDDRIRHLPLASLQRGTWVGCTDVSNIVIASGNTSFPLDLGIELVALGSDSSFRHTLLKRLGVEDLEPKIVVKEILRKHGSTFMASPSTLITHVRYVFEHRETDVQLGSLWLADTQGRLTRGFDLYMDDPRSASPSVALSSSLESARFIHPEFLASTAVPDHQRNRWMSFLQDNCGVSTAPRVRSGKPTPEFSALIDRWKVSRAEQLLCYLRDYWPGIIKQAPGDEEQSALNQYFGSVEIMCKNGKTAPLRSTYLLKSSMDLYATPDMPILPIDQPDSSWDFLGKCGVSTTSDAEFFLKRLILLSGSPNVQVSVVAGLYKHIETRFMESASQIRNAFKKERLLFVGKQWRGQNDVVWDGPSILTVKARLSEEYPHLEEVFNARLGIKNASPSIVGEELKIFAATQPDLQKADSINRIKDLLYFAGESIDDVKAGKCEDWTDNISDQKIFPVQLPDKSLTLCSPQDTFFIPDCSGSLSCFYQAHLPFLHFDTPDIISCAPLFNHLELEDKRIESHVTETILIDGTPVDAASDVGRVNEGQTELFQTRVPFLQRVQYHKRARRALVRSITVVDVGHIVINYKTDLPNTPKTIERALVCYATLGSSGGLTLFITNSPQTHDIIATVNGALGLKDENIMALSHIFLTKDDDLDSTLCYAGIHKIGPRQIEQHASRLAKLSIDSMPVASSAIFSEEVSTLVTSLAPLIATFDRATGSQPRRGSRQSKSWFSDVYPGHEISLQSYFASEAGRWELEDLQALAQSETTVPRISNVTTSRVDDILLGDNASLSTIIDFRHETSRSFNESTSAEISSGSFIYTGQCKRKAPSDSVEKTTRVGFLGEYYVFQRLKSILPVGTFSEENWTSPLRALAGFASFAQEGTSDFRYADTNGALTCALFEPEHPLRSARPLYHIEVKSTSGTQEEPFHMHRSQFLHALAMTRHDKADGKLPERVYVLFRVSGIGRKPELKTYEDVHDLLARGVLRIESQTVEVRVVS